MASSRSLGTLTLDLVAKIGGFTDALSKAARETNKHLSEIENSAKEFGETITKLLEVAGVTIGLDKTLDTIKETIEAMDTLGKQAQKIGLPVEQFSALAGAAKLFDVQADDLVTTLGRFSKSIAAATDGQSQQAQIFKALGINIKDTNGQLKNSQDLMDEFSDKFEKLGVNTTTTAAGIALFGKNFQNLIPFLVQGTEGIKAAEDEAIELGAALAGPAADAAHKFDDNLSKISLSTQGIKNQLVQALLPALDEWTDDIVGLAKDHSDLQNIANGLNNTLHVLAGIAIEVAAGFKVIAATIQTVTIAIAADAQSFSIAKDIYSHPFDIDRAKDNFKQLLNISSNARSQISDIWSSATDALGKSLDAAKKQFDEIGDTAPIKLATKGIVDLSTAVNNLTNGPIKNQKDYVAFAKQVAALGATAIKSGEDVAEVQSIISKSLSQGQSKLGNADALKKLQAALNPRAGAEADALAKAMQALSNAVQNVTDAADAGLDPVAKAFANYAKQARAIDQLGAAAIKAGAPISRVQDLVSKGVTGLQTQMETALKQQKDATDAYVQSLSDQLSAQKNVIDLKHQLIGEGTLEAQQQTQLAQIYVQGTKAVSDFERAHARNPSALSSTDYQTQLAALKDYWAGVVKITQDGQAQALQDNANFFAGMSSALADFIDSTKNYYQQGSEITKDFTDQASSDFGDFIDGTKSAGDAFKDFVNSLEADISKIVAKDLIGELLGSGSGSGGSNDGSFSIGGLVSLFGGGGYGTGHANGGPVTSGMTYPVNERGPELLTVGGKDYLMMGGQNGQVTPNNRLGSGGPGQTNNFYLSAPTSAKTQTQIAQKSAYELRRASRLG